MTNLIHSKNSESKNQGQIRKESIVENQKPMVEEKKFFGDDKRKVNSNIPRIQKLKEFLGDNKIFFDTLTPIIAVIALLVSFFTAYTANNISEGQRDIAQQAESPLIDLETEYDEDGHVKKVGVVNTGGVLEDMEIEIFPYVFYDLFYSDQKHNSDEYEYIKPLGVVPIELTVIDFERDYVDNKADLEKRQYKITSPHTKIGTLFEIQNTDLMNHISEMMKSDISKQLYSLKIESGRLVLNDNLEDQDDCCFFSNLSFEYIIKIQYSSLISEDENTECFRVSTGIGYGNDITSGVTKIKKGTWVSNIYNIVSTDSTQRMIIKGMNDTVTEDAENLHKYLLQQSLTGDYSFTIGF